MTTITKAAIGRWFFRCPDCLGTLATEGLTSHKHPCPYCGREDTEPMGRITRDGRIQTEEEAPPCDGRCTCAVGPDCRCRCGGENHGTHWVVRYTVGQSSVLVVERAIGIFKRRAEQLRAQAEEFRTVISAIRDRLELRYGPIIERKRAGEFLPADLFRQWLIYRQARLELSKAADLRVHKARMRPTRGHKLVRGVVARLGEDYVDVRVGLRLVTVARSGLEVIRRRGNKLMAGRRS